MKDKREKGYEKGVLTGATLAEQAQFEDDKEVIKE